MTTASDIETQVTPAEQARRWFPRARTSTIVGTALIAVVILASNFHQISHLVARWSQEPDYTHGFLVPLFSAWLLWQRRSLMPVATDRCRGRWLGAALLVSSAVIDVVATYLQVDLPGAVALIICLAGVPVLIGGYSALRWAWPSIVFLCFMVPLPGVVAGRLSGPLQHLATVASTYVLQTVGLPAISQGNIIWLSHGQIGVAEACSGLRMLMVFGAVTTAAVFVLKLANWEKVCLLISAPAIAITVNVIRILITGLALEFFGEAWADKIFHDLAGWIMMPLAVLTLALERYLLTRLFPTVPEGAPVVVRRMPAARSIR